MSAERMPPTEAVEDPSWPRRLARRIRCIVVFGRHRDRANAPTICGWTGYTCRRCGRETVR